MATASEPRAPKPDHNALGKAAFITGLIALILSFIPLIGFVSWLLAPLAILFGLIGVLRPSRSLAIAGLITGIIALFVCFSWLKGAEGVGKAMSADTFNTEGGSIDNSNAPILNATIKGVWSDIEDNKIAAGKKYGARRLQFSNERIAEISGDANSPSLSVVGKDEEYLSKLVSVSFPAAEADKIGGLKKGQKVSFICTNIKEGFGEGYSLSDCSMR